MEKLSTSRCLTKREVSFSFTFFGEGWGYEEAFKEQLKAVEKVHKKEHIQNQIYFLAGLHEPVYTLGKSKRCQVEKGQLQVGAEFVQTDRGGQLMYHGPGQLTLYPIFKLADFFSGPREYAKFMFDLCIDYFKETHQIELECRQNGLWFEGKKVGFLGLRVAGGVVYHGLSLNYNADLEAFKRYSPCDISGDQVGNIKCQVTYSEETSGRESFFKHEAEALSEHFLKVLPH